MEKIKELVESVRSKSLTEEQKKKLVPLLVVIALLMLLYILSIVAQILTTSQMWRNGEIDKMALVMNPLLSITFLFSKIGAKCLFLGAIGGTILVFYGKWYLSKDKSTKDERGFIVSSTGTYGTADWMDKKELQQDLSIDDVETTKGFIFGEKFGGVVTLPEKTRLNHNIAVFGAPGTMKSRAIVRPALFQAIRRGESVVITDPKGEMFNDTYALFKNNGYTVRVFNLIDPLHSDSWNCMGTLRKNGEVDTLLAQKLADIIIGNTSEGNGPKFWDDNEGNLLKALILFVMENNDYKEKNLGTVYSLLAQSFDSLKSVMAPVETSPTSIAKQAWLLYKQSGEKVMPNVASGLGTRLQVLQNKAVADLVSKSDIDLSLPAKEKCIYYVITSDQDSTMKFISSLFFSFIFIELKEYADSRPNLRCDVTVNFLLDEFNNIGKIGGASDGSDFAKTLSVVRSRGISILMAVQSLGQLENRYANNLWSELVGNCDTQILLGCNDERTSEFFSNRSGEMTIITESKRDAHKTFAVAEVIPVYQKSVGEGKRALLTPDEILRMPNNEMLLAVRGHNILKLNKMDYTKHPMAKEIEDNKTATSDYIPVNQSFTTRTSTPSNKSTYEAPEYSTGETQKFYEPYEDNANSSPEYDIRKERVKQKEEKRRRREEMNGLLGKVTAAKESSQSEAEGYTDTTEDDFFGA